MCLEYKSLLTDIKNYMRSAFFAGRKKHAPPLGKKSQHCGWLQHSLSFLDGTCSRRNSAGTDTLLPAFFLWRKFLKDQGTPLKVEKALLSKRNFFLEKEEKIPSYFSTATKVIKLEQIFCKNLVQEARFYDIMTYQKFTL